LGGVMLKLNENDAIVVGILLKKYVKSQSFVEETKLNKIKDGYYIYIKVSKWAKENYKKIHEILMRRFNIDIVSWTEHKKLETAEKTVLKDKATVVVEYPTEKGKTKFSTFIV
jgi:hypothetical protein